MSQKKFMLVIGNGGSARQLAKLGFGNLPSHIDTFGMGLAYRLYEKQGWWPTCYACCDTKVVHSNRDDFTRLLKDPAVSCEQFYLSLELTNSQRLNVIPHSSTGDFCVMESVRLGYDYILYVGMDRDYQEVIPEARRLTEREFDLLGYDELLRGTDPKKVGRDLLIIDRDPVINTNYFFDSYQRKGDVYSLPNASAGHDKNWERLFREVAQSDSTICNLSPTQDGTSKHSVTLRDVFDLDENELANRVRQSQRGHRSGVSLLKRWLHRSKHG